MRAVILSAALLLTGCSDVYRYPCQDPENKDKPECNRPACEADGMCYDSLNGLPPKQAETTETVEVPVVVTETTETIEVESTGE